MLGRHASLPQLAFFRSRTGQEFHSGDISRLEYDMPSELELLAERFWARSNLRSPSDSEMPGGLNSSHRGFHQVRLESALLQLFRN